MTLETIHSFVVDRSSVEDLVAMLAFGKLVQEEFENLDIDAPEWLSSKLRQIRRVVVEKNADVLEHKAANLRLQLEGLKTAGEKRREIEAQLAKLDKVAAGKG